MERQEARCFFKQRWRDTRQRSWGRMKGSDGRIETNQCHFVLCTTFPRSLWHFKSIREERTWIKFNYRKAGGQSINQRQKCFAQRQTLQLCETLCTLAAVQNMPSISWRQHLHSLVRPGASGPRWPLFSADGLQSLVWKAPASANVHLLLGLSQSYTPCTLSRKGCSF